jgi:two-component system response regulator DctR
MEPKILRVLLIEDDPMVQEVNRQFVEKVDRFRVVGAASNGAEGLAMLKKLQPDLVILDMYMPRQDGLETLRKIRMEGLDANVIVITAANDPETVQKALQHGALDYIMKPFKFERVKQALENFRSLRGKLDKGAALTQEELDRMLHRYTKAAADADQLPKGIHEQTLKQILLFLSGRKESLSAEEVAEGVGLARVTARRYLDYLEKTGQVRLDMQYGGVGRPVNRYRLS